jgi:exosortase
LAETLKSSPDSPSPWSPWLGLAKSTMALLGVLLLLLALPALTSWFTVLSERTLQQNSIQVLVLIMLTAAIRQKIIRSRPGYNPCWKGLFMMALAGLAYLLGVLLGVKALLWGSLLLVMAFLFWTLFGFQAFYGWMGIFLFSFFLLPEVPIDLKMSISLPLQLLSTQVTQLLAGLFIPITAAGNIFYINGQAYEVTVACSGLNTWIGFMFAGLLWLLFERFSVKTLITILIAAPLLALALNSVRLLITALVAYWQSPDAGLAVHTNIQFLLFPLGLVLMWGIIRRLHATGP